MALSLLCIYWKLKLCLYSCGKLYLLVYCLKWFIYLSQSCHTHQTVISYALCCLCIPPKCLFLYCFNTLLTYFTRLYIARYTSSLTRPNEKHGSSQIIVVESYWCYRYRVRWERQPNTEKIRCHMKQAIKLKLLCVNSRGKENKYEIDSRWNNKIFVFNEIYFAQISVVIYMLISLNYLVLVNCFNLMISD